VLVIVFTSKLIKVCVRGLVKHANVAIGILKIEQAPSPSFHSVVICKGFPTKATEISSVCPHCQENHKFSGFLSRTRVNSNVDMEQQVASCATGEVCTNLCENKN
jgi:hypothetical protein